MPFQNADSPLNTNKKHTKATTQQIKQKTKDIQNRTSAYRKQMTNKENPIQILHKSYKIILQTSKHRVHKT